MTLTQLTPETMNSFSTRKVVTSFIALAGAAAILAGCSSSDGDSADTADSAATGEMSELERGALREGVLTLSDETMRTDHWEHELAPYEAIEFKYTMDEGQPMIFTWKADAPVEYDLHSHPFEGGEDLTESYGVGQADKMQGLYVAPFSGIHGWYWQNRTMENVKITLDATGGITHSTLFEGGGAPQERPLEGAEAPSQTLPDAHTMRSADEE